MRQVADDALHEANLDSVTGDLLPPAFKMPLHYLHALQSSRCGLGTCVRLAEAHGLVRRDKRLFPSTLHVFAGVSLLAEVITGSLDIDSYDGLLPASYSLPFLLYMLVFTGIYEEPGWRGFALPYLQRDNTAIRASWILGVLWGVWHFPVIIYYNLTVTEVPPPELIPILAGLVMGTVGWTIVNTWIYNSTESVFLMILLHGWYNTVNAFLVLPFENMMVATVNAVLPWTVAVLVSKRYGDDHLADRQRPALVVPTPT